VNPTEIVDEVRGDFVRYYESPFGLRSATLERERHQVLSAYGGLAQEPLIEFTPRYAFGGKTLQEICDRVAPGSDFGAFADCGLFRQNRTPYLHQRQAIEASTAGNGTNLLVTTGTGSGKTETFLMPVLLRILREARDWKSPSADSEPWWRAKVGARYTYSPQRAGATRPSAVRALVLYPMNALVEDQLRRLREALGSEAARRWYEGSLASNRIYFGRYTGRTPEPGAYGIKPADYAKRLMTLEEQVEALEKSRATLGEVEYAKRRPHFQRLDGAEMRGRWDMMADPPDILITNYSMLNVMLRREYEAAIFEKTAAWLAEDSAREFTLIVDELHMYRGTAGTEVALMLRNALSRFGIEPGSKQLRIIATSASFGDDDAVATAFLSEFFAADPTSFRVLRGEQECYPVTRSSYPEWVTRSRRLARTVTRRR